MKQSVTMSTDKLPTATASATNMRDIQGSPTSMMHTTLNFTSPLNSNFNKTIGYLKSSHSTPKVQGYYDVINDTPRDKDEAKLEHALALEIEKFNKVKLQKQVQFLDFDKLLERS